MIRTPIATFPETNGIVRAMEIYKGVLYICGDFTTVNGLPRVNLAALDPYSGAVLPFNPVISSTLPILCMTFLNDVIYVGGAGQIHFSGGTNNRVAAFSVDGTPQTFNPDPNTTVNSMATDGTWIYMVGDFTLLAGGTIHKNRAARSSVLGVPDNTWNPSLDATALKIVISGNQALIGGNFTHVNGALAIEYGASFDLSTGVVFPSGWYPGTNSSIQDFTVEDSKVYVVGSFTTINGGTARVGFAMTDLQGVVDPSINLGLNASGNRVEVLRGKILIGGAFSTVLGQTRFYFAVINPDGTLSDFDMDSNSVVLGMVFMPGGFILGGPFTSPRNYLAAFFDPVLSIPRSPEIEFLNRKSTPGGLSLTILKWKPVALDASNNYTAINGYRIYRTASLNLEDPVLIAEITTFDIRGFVDCVFTENIDGFFKYCVSAFNDTGESRKSCIAKVPLAQSDRI